MSGKDPVWTHLGPIPDPLSGSRTSTEVAWLDPLSVVVEEVLHEVAPPVPLTFQVTVPPVGAVAPAGPVTVAVKVKLWPKAGVALSVTTLVSVT